MVSIKLRSHTFYIISWAQFPAGKKLCEQLQTFIMTYAVIRSVHAALKYRGGWKGLFEHMYTVSSSLAWRRFTALCFVWLER
jgi:hypothetical protein